LAEEQEDQRFKGTEVAWRKMHPKRWSNVRDVEILATLKKLANWPRLEKMVRELHQGTRLVSILYMNHVVCHHSIEELWGHAAKILTNNMLILQNDILLSLITCNPSIATIDNHISFIHDIATVTYEYNRIA